MLEPREYGASLGGYQVQDVDPIPDFLRLRNGGLDHSQPADQIEEGASPYALDVRFDKGGVSPDFDVATFGSISASAADRNIMKMAPFEIGSGTKFVIRMRPTKWDRWNGANWLELGGTLTGTTVDRLNTVIYGDLFIGANGIDKLKSWDGIDGNAVADLSADAPIAKYITKVGNRILAARIKIGVDLFPFMLQWSTDGDVTDWTTALDGAGEAEVGPEGTNKSAGFITGLSTLEGAGVIYRQRSIMLAVQTGAGAAPFRITTLDFSHGTLSPESISGGGEKTGDYFLGDDFMVYFFDGRNLPVPIGDPIIDVLRTAIYDPAHVIGRVDTHSQEYWLAYPTDNSLLPKRAYVFSIREWVKSQRLVWRQRFLSETYRSMDFTPVPTSTDPIVDTQSQLVESDNRRVNDYANTSSDDRIVFGSTVGQAYYQDLNTPVTSGVWHSKSIGDWQNEYTIERVRLVASAPTVATVEVSISVDGGDFLNPIVYSIPISPTNAITVPEYFGVDYRTLQFQLRILTGNPVVTQIAYTRTDHGRAA